MYDTVADPYCYQGTTVLKNLADIRTQADLDTFEAEHTARRSDEPLPAGQLDVAQYRAIHRHLFQDVYAWAGELRTVRLGKEGSAFCYPEHIEAEMQSLFSGLQKRDFLTAVSKDEFAKQVSTFLSALNAIHPFREGNGRTQLTFLALLASQAGHPLNLSRLEPEPFLAAMIASFRGNDSALATQIRRLI